MCVLLVFSLLFVGPVFGGVTFSLETVLSVTRCRALCLDQFSHVIRTEEICRKNLDCLMCWETCQMLNENFQLWGPMCSVRDICFPGCQTACNSVYLRNNESEPTYSSNVTLKSAYDPHIDRVSVEWVSNYDMSSDGTILYTLLLGDQNEEWYQIAQTTFHVLHVRRSLFTRNTLIRLLGANATSKVIDIETTYLDSLIFPLSEPPVMNNKAWKPHLESMERSKISIGLLTTIAWPKIVDNSGNTKYEVSWNVIDDTMEITGHLYTVNNIVELTLWPNSIYSVQVKSYGSEGVVTRQSEPLIIDTRASHQAAAHSSSEMVCKTDRNATVETLGHIFVFLTTCVVITLFICLLKRKIMCYKAASKEHIRELNGKMTSLTQQLKNEQEKKGYLSDSKFLLNNNYEEKNSKFNISDRNTV